MHEDVPEKCTWTNSRIGWIEILHEPCGFHMIEKAGRLPAHWPFCLFQAMDLHDDDDVRYPVWTCRDPISLILGTRFYLILGTRFSILGTQIRSLKHLKIRGYMNMCFHGWLPGWLYGQVTSDHISGLHNSEGSKGQIDQQKFAAGRKNYVILLEFERNSGTTTNYISEVELLQEFLQLWKFSWTSHQL